MRTISQGHTGSSVQDVQRRLEDLDLPIGDDVPGEFGTGTVAAVRAFQQSRGLGVLLAINTRLLGTSASPTSLAATERGSRSVLLERRPIVLQGPVFLVQSNGRTWQEGWSRPPREGRAPVGEAAQPLALEPRAVASAADSRVRILKRERSPVRYMVYAQP